MFRAGELSLPRTLLCRLNSSTAAKRDLVSQKPRGGCPKLARLCEPAARRTSPLNPRNLQRGPVHVGQAGSRFNSSQRIVDHLQNRRNINSEKVGRKKPQSFLRLLEVNEDAAIDLLPKLMIRGRQLD